MSEEFSFWNNTIDNLDCEVDRGPDLRCLGFTLDLIVRSIGGSVIITNSGGVCIEWVSEDERKHITLAIEPDPWRKYLYRECVVDGAGEHITTEELTPEVLFDWLSWLKSTDKPIARKFIDMLIKGDNR